MLAKIPFHFFSIEIESPFLFFERMSKIGRNFLLLLLRFISNQKTFFVSRWKNQKFSISKLSWEFGFSMESSKVPRLGTLRYENESFQASFCWFRHSNIKWFIYQNCCHRLTLNPGPLHWKRPLCQQCHNHLSPQLSYLITQFIYSNYIQCKECWGIGAVVDLCISSYLLLKNQSEGGRHSSVVSSAPTILRPRVRIPSTPSMLFQFVIDLWCKKDENKRKRGRDWPMFLRIKVSNSRWYKGKELEQSKLLTLTASCLVLKINACSSTLSWPSSTSSHLSIHKTENKVSHTNSWWLN